MKSKGALRSRMQPGAMALAAVLALASCSDSGGGKNVTGGLDGTVGQGGLVGEALGGGADDTAHGLVVLTDGRVVMVGEARPDAQSLRSFALVRYLKNGGLDTTFGNGGKVFTPFGDTFGSGANAVAVQPDGKIVAVGFANNPDQAHDTFAAARYNADGSLDSSFGNSGGVVTAVDAQTGAGRNDIARAVAIDAQARIVVVGETGGAVFHDIALVRYLPDGSLDGQFGTGGMVVTDLGADDVAASVAIAADGKIVVGGSGGTNPDYVVLRYLESGVPDSSFGQDGRVATDFRGGTDKGQGVVIRPDGKIALGGVVQLSGGCFPKACERYGMAVMQYTADGMLDMSFGTGGITALDLTTSSGGYGLARLADGHLVLVGHIGNEDFGVALLRENGQLETGFGEAGLLRTSFGPGKDAAVAAGSSPDGAIWVGGTATADTGTVFALASYRLK